MKGIKMFALAALAILAFSSSAHSLALTAQQIDNDGLTTSYSSDIASTHTYTVTNDGRTFLHFKKTEAGSALTVTIVTQQTVQGIAIADRTVSVPASTGDVLIGPFSPSLFNDSNGAVNFTISTATGGVTIGVFRL